MSVSFAMNNGGFEVVHCNLSNAELHRGIAMNNDTVTVDGQFFENQIVVLEGDEDDEALLDITTINITGEFPGVSVGLNEVTDVILPEGVNNRIGLAFGDADVARNVAIANCNALDDSSCVYFYSEHVDENMVAQLRNSLDQRDPENVVNAIGDFLQFNNDQIMLEAYLNRYARLNQNVQQRLGEILAQEED